MSDPRPAGLQGGDPKTVRAALDHGEALPGTAGFAGRLGDRLVRDVLGRYPLFSAAEGYDPGDPSTWSADLRDLDEPRRVPAGTTRTADGDRTVWTLPAPAPRGGPEAVAAVRGAVADAVDRVPARADGADLAVAFSGGLDSALVAARLEAPLFVAGFPDSPDVAAAREAAALLDRDLSVVRLAHDDLERAVPRVARATGRTNAMDVGIALSLFLVAEAAAAAGVDRLVLGGGADELFGGYAKVAKAPADPRVDAVTVRGARREVMGTLPDQLERDVLALRAAGVEPVTPLLHDDVVRAALALPGEQLVTDAGERKHALRLAAREWLPDRIAFRKKRAVQYGSRVSRELDRLARQAGFKRRMDDHLDRYVESLVAE